MTKALIFDCDGVLADTERDGHRVAFNETFDEVGAPFHWSEEEYGELLKIGGGKERMRAAVLASNAPVAGTDTDEGLAAILADWHKRKTQRYLELVESGSLPARPGVRRLAQEAFDAGWVVAIASTSAQASVEAVARHVLGEGLASHVRVFAGDVVPRKKPAPDIYLHALGELGVEPADAVVVEDSGIGVTAAAEAGLAVVATVSSYTADEDLSRATAIVSDLGEATAPCRVIADPAAVIVGPVVDLAAMERIRDARG